MMTDESNSFRSNDFSFSGNPQNYDWNRLNASHGTFVNNIYNGYPIQLNQNQQPSSFPFFSNVANPFSNVNPFTCTTNVSVPGFTDIVTQAQSDFTNMASQNQALVGLNEFRNLGGHAVMRCKRKTDSPPPVARKQHITEERMALHMSQLHISSESAPESSKLETESNEIKEKRLYMCEEMRRLQTDSILPKTLLDKLQKPCTALVLWQPPPVPFPLPNTEPVDEEDNNNNNNNSEGTHNNNSAIEDVEIEEEEGNMDLDMR